MIFIGHHGQGPVILIVPIRSPSGSLEVLDDHSIRVYTSLAGDIIVCIEKTLRTGANTDLVAIFGELEEIGKIGEIGVVLVASTGLDETLRSGEGLDGTSRIGEPLDEQLLIGGLDKPARVVELDMIARSGSGLDVTLKVCE